jgi:hypothetical protein
MSILLTGTGGLFTRWGRIAAYLNGINAFRGTTDLTAASIRSVGPYTDNVFAQFTSADQNLMDRWYSTQDTFRASFNTQATTLQTLFGNVLTQMANEDTPLASVTIPAALQLLISQMKTGSQTVTKPTVSVAVTAGSNTGDGQCVASTTDTDGLVLDYVFAEPINLTVTNDSYSGSAIAGREPISWADSTFPPNSLSFLWPGGSGAGGNFNAVDATQNQGDNLLFNSGFDTFVSVPNVPDHWSVLVGSPGSQILQGTGGNVYKGAASLAFVGDSTTLTSVTQPLNNAGGSTVKLRPNTVYMANLWIKVSSVPAAGVLEVALINSGSGAIIQDAQGTNNSFTKTLSGATTSFVALNGVFRTPVSLPATYGIRVRLSTALSTSSTLYLDNLALATGTQLYPGGLFSRVFSGATPFQINDSFTATVSNNYSSKWAQALDRFLNLRTLGLKIPSSGSPTISDSLIS